MQLTTKIRLWILLGSTLSAITYISYIFFQYLGLLLPTGILFITIIITSLLNTTIKMSNNRNKSIFLANKNKQYGIPKTIWIFWSFIASIFIIFFNGQIGNAFWCLLTIILLFLDIKKKRNL